MSKVIDQFYINLYKTGDGLRTDGKVYYSERDANKNSKGRYACTTFDAVFDSYDGSLVKVL